MAGIKATLKQGKQWWYVIADFGDGEQPVVKGPMREADARKMVAELEEMASTEENVMVKERSDEEARANRRAAIAFLVLVGGAVISITAFVISWITQ